MAESLGAALLTIGVDLDSFNAGLQQAQKLAANAGNDISKKLDARRATLSALQQQLTTLEAKLKTNPWSAAALEAPIKALRAEIELRQQSIKLLEKQIGITESAKARTFAAQPGGGSEFLQGALGAVPGAGLVAGGLGPAVIGAAIGAAGVAAVKTANDFQKLNQQLTLLTGNAAITDSVLRELKDYAAKTPFDLPGVAENAKLLLAYGLNTQQAVEFTKRLGDVATVTGTPLDRLALNFGQIVSQGKAYTVDLKQFSLAGVPIFESLSKVTGKSVEQLKALGTAIPADQVVAAFRQMTNEGGKFFQGGEKGGTKLDANFANLVDTAKELGDAVGKIITPEVLNAIDTASDSVKLLTAGFQALQSLKGIPILNDILGVIDKAGPGGLFKPLAAPLKSLSKELDFTFGKKPGQGQSAQEANAEVQRLAQDRIAAFKKEQQAKEDARLAALVPLQKEQALGQAAIAQAQQQYAETLKLSQLKGDVRDVAAEQLRIDAALAAEAKAYVDAFNAQQGKDPVQAQKLQDAATVASINLRKAMVEGAAAMKAALANAEQRFKAAGEAVKSALDQQDSARVSAFDVITDAAQQETRARLLGRVQEGINAGQLDPNKIRQVVGPDLGTLDIGALADLAGKSSSLLDAQDGLISANKELKEATTNLATVQQLLAEKDWGVNVSVFADGTSQAYGDVVNRAI